MKTFAVAVLCLLSAMVYAQQETVVSGKLLGHDGKAIAKAHVHLLRGGEPKPLVTTQSGKDGSYRVATSEQGLLRLQFTGINHEPYEVPLLAEEPVLLMIDVRLAPYPYKSEITEVNIIGDFNNFSFNTAKAMTQEANGTYVAEFETEAPTFKYQILGVIDDPRSINGTQSDDFEYDGGGDYQSVVRPVGGKVRIVFDPRKVIRSSSPARATFDSKNKDAETFAVLYAASQDRRKTFMKTVTEYRTSGKDMKDFTYDWSAEFSSLSKQIQSENNARRRQYLLLSYVDLSTMAQDGVDSVIALRALKEIPYESPLWSLNPGLVMSAMYRAGSAFDREAGMDEFIARNKDKNLKAVLLFNQMMTAQFSQQTEKFKATRKLLIEEYGDTQQGKLARDRFPEESKIAVGKQIPKFRIASLDQPESQFSNETLRGMTTLIDFWAVWCGPCIAEMDNLHKAYDRFKGKKFQILSLSFDPKPDDVSEFRQKKWKMPWLHAFVEQGFNSELAKGFEVMGIPKPILVDEKGNILAMETDLRGPNLEKTLEQFLGK